MAPDIFTEIIIFFKHIIAAVVISSARISTCLFITPFMRQENMPPVVATILGISLSITILPSVYDYLTTNFNMVVLIMIIIKEVSIGYVLGLILGLYMWIFEAVGNIFDTQRGASTGSITNLFSMDQTQPMGAFLSIMFIYIAFNTGIFLLLLKGLYASYDIIPVFNFVQFHKINIAYIITIIDQFMSLILLFTSPLIIAMLLTEITMVFFGKFVPQLNVFILSMPAKCLIGFLVLLVYFPHLLKESTDRFIHYLTGIVALLKHIFL